MKFSELTRNKIPRPFKVITQIVRVPYYVWKYNLLFIQ